jgi:archaellum component FlaC
MITDQIEQAIENLNNIPNWTDKINTIKNIKDDIQKEEQNISKLIEQLENEIIIVKSKKNLNIDELIENISKEKDIKNKIRNYHLLNDYINSLDNELFDS